MNDIALAKKPPVIKPQHKIRFVTAASLFDGHDASINIMRRILQATGCEVIHLGHNRSVEEIVTCALQEDAHGIAISSYQGGHVEFFKYMLDLLRERGGANIKVFGGGGGVIVADEIDELHRYGVTRIFSPEDGARLGLQGMINEIVTACDADLAQDLPKDLNALKGGDRRVLARFITGLEAEAVPPKLRDELLRAAEASKAPVLGITGTGGAGKSSLTDELIRRFRLDQDDKLRIAVISIDPSRRKSGGALLGDRIRMNAIHHPNIYMRSMATRDSFASPGSEISKSLPDAIAACKVAGFDLIVVETSGIGQGDAAIVPLVDTSLYVMTPEFGAASQLEKIDMLDFADFVAINKFDRKGAADALRDVRKQYQRNRELFAQAPDTMPVFGTIAARFNDDGVTALYQALGERLTQEGLKLGPGKLPRITTRATTAQNVIVPPARSRYLADIAETVRGYHGWARAQAKVARERQQLTAARAMVDENLPYKERLAASEHVSDVEAARQLMATTTSTGHMLDALIDEREKRLEPRARKLLDMWPQTKAAYTGDEYVVKIRGKEIRSALTTVSLSGTHVPKVALPKYEDDGEILRWQLTENVPGSFPFTAGVFAFKRENEDPTRMFAGEGDAFRTNKRFHLLADNMPAKRLSTAFDSVTLYGNDPAVRPDIYGKVGNSGVSIATLDDMKVLYSGLRPVRPEDLRVDDHQRSGADDPGVLHEHRHRPAAGQVPRGKQARAHRRRSAEDQGLGAVNRARDGAGGHPERGPGPEHLHLFHGIQPQGDGRHPGILRPARREEFLLGVDLRVSHRGGRSEPDQPARLHAVQWLHLCRSLSRARHAHRRLRAQSEFLLQLRDGSGVRGDRPRRAPHLGGGDARTLRRQRAQPEAQVPLADQRA